MIDNFTSYEEKEKTFNLVNSYYSIALNFYSSQLNRLHNVKKPLFYWEVILGRWVKEICLIYIDRSKNLRRSNESEVRLFREQLKYNTSIPDDYNDFYKTHQSMTVEANILYSKLIQSERESFFLDKKIKIQQLKKVPIAKFIYFSVLKNFFSLLSLINGKSLYLFSTEQFTRLEKLKIFLKSKGKILFYIDPLFSSSEEKEISLNSRFTLSKEIIGSNYLNTEKELLFFLLKSMPKSYIENFNYLRSLQNFNFPKKTPKKIFLDSRFRNDDCFNVQLAEWVVKGSETKVLQHDLNSLIDFDSLYECDSVFDEYLFWNDRQFPPPLRINSFAHEHSKSQTPNFTPESDLFVCRAIPTKQSVSLAYTMSHAGFIVQGRKKLSSLSEKLEKQIFIRNRQGNVLNLSEDTSYFKTSNNIKFADDNNDIHSLFGASRIIVFEGFSTGIYQCLSINKPFLIFLNEDYLEIRSSKFKPLISDLRDMGIICTSPSQLVDSLSSKFIKKHETPAFQNKLLKLKDRYVPISKNYLEDWINYILDADGRF